MLNRRLPEVPCLLLDNARGMRRAMEHLGELGHTSVTYLAGPEASWTDGVRWMALREAAHELEMRVRRVGPTPTPTIDAGFTRVPEIMAHPTTAVLAYNDVLAIGVVKGLHRLHLAVPDDVSVVGVDNITFETDYPHTDSTWPDTKVIAEGFMQGLPEEAVYKIMRGNAIRMLNLDLDRDRVPAPA